MTEPSEIRHRNHLLRDIPRQERDRIDTHLQPVTLTRGQVLLEAGEEVKAFHFPETCVISLLQPYASGQSVETATVGCEGVVCVATALSVHESSIARHVVQIEGEAMCMTRGLFVAAMENLPGFRKLILKYASAFVGASLLSTACNRLHPVEQRLARWLLLTRDRSITDVIALTHDQISEMLGVHRPTVTNALRSLEVIGAIDMRRGRVAIADRSVLEAAACECYEMTAHRLPAGCGLENSGDPSPR